MFNSLIVLGLPKSGTTYLSRFFHKQSNYTIIKDTKDEFHHNIKEITDFNYTFGKNPDISLYYHADTVLKEWIEHIDTQTHKCLFLIILRSFNSCLYSIYKHRQKYSLINNTITYQQFFNEQKKHFLQIEQNCIDIANTIKNNQIKIIFQSDLQNINTLLLLNDLGIDKIEESSFPYDNHKEFIYTSTWNKYTNLRPKNNDYFIDDELEKAYFRLLMNKHIEAMTHSFDSRFGA